MNIKDLKFEFHSHVSYSRGAELFRVAIYKGMSIKSSTWTKKKKDGDWGKGKTEFYIDKEKRAYTEAELIEELEKRTLKINK